MRQIHSAPAGASTQRERAPRERERADGFLRPLVARCCACPGELPCLFSSRFGCGRKTRSSSTNWAVERVELQRQQAQLDEARHVVALMEAKDTKTVALASQPGMAKGSGPRDVQRENGHGHVRRLGGPCAREQELPVVARPDGRQAHQRGPRRVFQRTDETLDGKTSAGRRGESIRDNARTRGRHAAAHRADGPCRASLLIFRQRPF